MVRSYRQVVQVQCNGSWSGRRGRYWSVWRLGMAVYVSGSVCGAVEHCQAARCRVVKQVVRRVQCGGSSGCMHGLSNVWQCGSRVVRCGVGGQCAVVRLVFAWLPAWLPPAWLLICVAPPVASGGLRWLPRMRLACLPDTIHIPIALQFTLVAPVDVPCGGCLPVQ